MNTIAPSDLSLRLSSEILHMLSSISMNRDAIRHLIRCVEQQTPVAVVISILSPRVVMAHRAGSIPKDVQQLLLDIAVRGSDEHTLLAMFHGYEAAFSMALQMNNGAPVGVAILLAATSKDAQYFPYVEQPLLSGLKIILSELHLSARSEQLLKNQAEFVRIVTHDLRSPLTAIHGFASMLEEGAVGRMNDKQQHYISKVVTGTLQLASLIDNIADAGRYDPETGFYEMRRVPMDPNDLVRKVVNSYLVPAEKSDLTVSVEVSDETPILNVDEHMFERVTINLVDNAIKYTANGGHVTVGVRADTQRLYLYVSDTGNGIKPEDLQKLFQRHVRLRHPEHKQVGGVGLGLFIVRSVALRHGGEAFAESEIGKGSTFGIWIPLNSQNLIVD